LSTKDINEFCDIGSAQGPLTVSYQKHHLEEYRRFNPKFNAESPAFFGQIAEFYCTGEFIGFDRHDVTRSPVLLSWLEHEIEYGENQRLYTRAFLNHLATEKQKLNFRQMSGHVKCDAPWQRKLLRELGEMLWEKVKKGVRHEFPKFDSREAWQSSEADVPDFRFTNLNTTKDNINHLVFILEVETEVVRMHFLNQMISAYQFDQFDSDEIELIKSMIRSLNVRGLHTFLRDRKKVKAVKSEPRDVMILN